MIRGLLRAFYDYWFSTKYYCYLCSKMKLKSAFGKCAKPHVKRVRGADINFACKKCAKS